MVKFSKLMSAAMILSLATAACSKKRNAALPDSEQPNIFAISDFGTLDEKTSGISLKTSSSAKELSLADSARAANEKGLVGIESADVKAPDRLRFMFSGLELQGAPGREYKVVFGVDQDYVTAYKVVNDASELSLLERQLATNKDRLSAEIAMQKTGKVSERQKQRQSALSARDALSKSIAAGRASSILVPIFKYKIESFGILERSKNELREDTSVLRLKATEFGAASHVKISSQSTARLLTNVAPGDKDTLDEVFVVNKINNRVMTAAQLRDELKITTSLPDDAIVLVNLDGGNLVIFEITNSSKISEGERQILATSNGNGRVLRCSDTVKASASADNREDCVMARRLVYPVTYVNPKLPDVSWEGTKSNELKFDTVRPNASTGLVRIPRNAEPVLANDSNQVLDPRSTIKIADVQGKEFFFRRTAIDSTATSPIGSGYGGPVMLVKFSMEENKVVIRRTEKLVDFHGDNRALDSEEILSFPVIYYRMVTKDNAGNNLAIPKPEAVERERAEMFIIDWTKSTIPTAYSPLAFYQQGACVLSTSDKLIKDLDARLTQGILSFSLEYSVTMNPGCAPTFKTVQDYSGAGEDWELNQKLTERISFKANDGRTDTAYAPMIPFSAQNALGFGGFTTGNLRPTAHGEMGREGMEDNHPFTHDFRDGRKLSYLIGGLPEKEGRVVDLDGESVDLHDLYANLAREVVADWNKALHRAFKGTNLDRTGDYVEVAVNGENGVNAQLGDLDRNFIWFSETINDGGTLGISQNGVNPRSGVSVSDFVAMYTGNFRNNVAYHRRIARLVQEHNRYVEELRQKEIKALAATPTPITAPSADPEAVRSEKPDVGSADTQRLVQHVRQQANYVRSLARGLENPSLHMLGARLRTVPVNMIASQNALRTLAARLRETGTGVRADKDTLAEQFLSSQLGDKVLFHRVLRKAMELGPDRDPEDLEIIAAQEMLDVYGKANKLQPIEKEALRSKIKTLSTRAQMKKLATKFPGCAFPAATDLDSNFDKLTFKESLVRYVKWALAHELGHSLGLTHNFVGSGDPVNFRFEDEPTYTRTTSTVMDYVTPQDAMLYGGPGPYDVHALRALYTGLVETATPGQFISTAELKTKVGDQWVNLTDVVTRNWPLRKYRYCTDIDVGGDPTCKRFDRGRNPLEVVRDIEQQYETLYIQARHGYDRLRFGTANASAVQARVTGLYLDARQFFDEMVYRLVLQLPDQIDGAALMDAKEAGLDIKDPKVLATLDTVNGTYRKASAEVYAFLLNIVHTPEADTNYLDREGRFKAVTYEAEKVAADGKTKAKSKEIAVVETRALQDRDASDSRLDTIGIEMDKVTAMEVLTMKGLPMRRYSRYSLGLSFMEFEKFFMGVDTPDKSPIANLLLDLLSENLSASTRTAGADSLQLASGDFNTTVSQAMRLYAGVNAIIGLNATTLEDRDNFATLFKVRSVLGAPPTDRSSVAKADAVANSSQRLSFVAIDGAIGADALVTASARILPYTRPSENLKKAIWDLYAAQSAVDAEKDATKAAATKQKVEDVKAALAKTLKDDGFSKEQLYSNPDVIGDKDPHAFAADLVASITEVYASSDFRATIASVGQILAAQEQGSQPDPKVSESVIQALSALKGSVAQLMNIFPMAGLTQQILKDGAAAAAQKQPQLAPFATAIRVSSVDTNFAGKYGKLINSLEFMAMLSRATNPELNR